MPELTITVPGDKSLSHRAVIFGALLPPGTAVTFQHFLLSDDCLHTISCFQQMGVTIKIDRAPEAITVHGVGLSGLRPPTEPLYVGNSGTTIRLLSGILAAQKFPSQIGGDESITQRPMSRVIDPLRAMGGRVRGQARAAQAYPPLKIEPAPHGLRPLKYRMPLASAQVDSCLRLAGLCGGVPVEIDKNGFLYRDHTEFMLQWYRHATDAPPLAFYHIPGDISSAAFFIIAGLLRPQTKLVLPNIIVNPTRAGILKVLHQMGAKINPSAHQLAEIWQKKELGSDALDLTADIVVQTSNLRGTIIAGEIIPTLIDEIPIIALAASLATGETIIKDAFDLRHKESDRIATTVTELSRIGADIEARPDGMIIRGRSKLAGSDQCRSYGDHRIAMMLRIAGLITEKAVKIIDDPECIRTSFPGFEDLLKAIA